MRRRCCRIPCEKTPERREVKVSAISSPDKSVSGPLELSVSTETVEGLLGEEELSLDWMESYDGKKEKIETVVVVEEEVVEVVVEVVLKDEVVGG